VTNSLGIAPISRIDDLKLAIDMALLETLISTYEAAPWDLI
jgi:hypothetical protein